MAQGAESVSIAAYTLVVGVISGYWISLIIVLWMKGEKNSVR